MTDRLSLTTGYELYPLGEQAVVIRWEGGIGEQTRLMVSRCMTCLGNHKLPEVVELAAAYRTVTVYYDPVAMFMNSQSHALLSKQLSVSEAENGLVPPYEEICRWIHSCLKELQQESGHDIENGGDIKPAPVRVVPVCFGEAYGPDLEAVALHAGMREEEAVELYCSVNYLVHMIGFVPGFPYLGGLPKRLAMPRRDVPRAGIAAGSVGIAGEQTGIYPLSTPGGWQLIGRTPLKLFDPDRAQPSLLQAGDTIRFQPISAAEFMELDSEKKDAEAEVKAEGGVSDDD